MTYWQAWKQYPIQIFLSLDQFLNAIIPPVTGTLSYADETLSARSYRAHRDSLIFGKLTMPVIDFLFLWQTPDVFDDGVPVKGHCQRAWRKEIEKRHLPPEYRK